MPEERRYVGCTVKLLPPEQRVEAARTAVGVNRSNMPLIGRAVAGLAALTPEHIAGLTGKLWAPTGVKLTVQFLDNPDAETRRKILAAANKWSKTANISFTETAGQGQVRLARTRGQGYWSYLGTDVLHIPANQQTMNLDSFTASTPDSEYNRVVTHEFGHTLGWPHEHERPEIIARLDPEKTIAYFMQTQGWSRDEVIQQLLTPPPDIDPRSLPSDVRSIMCYELPGSITKDGQPIPGGLDIDEEDARLAGILYPRADTGGGGTPPPNPPPNPPLTPPTARLFSLTFSRQVPQGGRVAFRAPVAIPAGSYSVVAAGQGSDEVLADAGV
jgi:hypothetical protein